MLNYIWLCLVLLAVVLGGATGHLDGVVKGGFDMAKTAVMEIALPLSAIMTIWLGVMRLADRSGLVVLLARGVRPVMRRLFPDVPHDHPAMGAMVMNISANMLGLGNAATPLGLRAMAELEKLNPCPGTATNAMCTFLAINTASIQLIPATAIGILAINGGTNPTAIVGTAFLATVCAQITGLTAVKFFEKLPIFRVRPEAKSAAAPQPAPAVPAPGATLPEPIRPLPAWGKLVLVLFALFFVYLLVGMLFPTLGWISTPDAAPDKLGIRAVKSISLLAIPFFLSFFPLYSALRGVKVYEEFIEGAKEGFGVAIRIIPYLVTILVAVGMFRGANGFGLIAKAWGRSWPRVIFRRNYCRWRSCGR